MLSNLASYLGYSSAPVERTPPSTVTADVRVRDEEDDWVLVESSEREGNSQPTEIDDDTGLTRVTLAISTCPATLPGSSKNLSRSVSLDISCPLQESWYLTPPPSFTSDGPVHMETSPLENMLIEHPSMSVYEHNSRRNSSTPNPSPCDEEASIRPSSPTRLPRNEQLNKVPRKNILSRKLNARRANEEGTSESEEKTLEAEEPNVNFVKLRRMANNAMRAKEGTSETKEKTLEAEEPNVNFDKLVRMANNAMRAKEGTSETKEKTLEAKEPTINFKLRRRVMNAARSQRVPNVLRGEPSDEMISGTEKCESGPSAEVQVVPTRKLYSEVLASKPKPPPVQEPTPEPVPEAKEQEVPETVSPSAEGEAAAVENESVMSVEETPEDEADEGGSTDVSSGSSRRLHMFIDHQQRQKSLNRSAQKVEQRKTCDLMKRNPLIRTNKAREINFRNKRQRRADMMQRHSGANNNRKC